MSRVVAGRWGGRVLATPLGTITRPTSERVRAALGNALEATGGLAGARVLDLYAGSGALGLELLSRGAASLVMIERDRKAVASIELNVRSVGAEAQTRLVTAGVSAAAVPRGQPFDIVLADPPYDVPPAEVAGVLVELATGGLLVPGADLIVERSVRSPSVPWGGPLAGTRIKRYGDTVLDWGTVRDLGTVDS